MYAYGENAARFQMVDGQSNRCSTGRSNKSGGIAHIAPGGLECIREISDPELGVLL